MEFWNYRIVRRTQDDEGKPLPWPQVGIHEAYYEEAERDNESLTPNGITVNPVAPIAEDVEGLRVVLLEMMAAAFDKPVLDWEQIGSSSNENKNEGNSE